MHLKYFLRLEPKQKLGGRSGTFSVACPFNTSSLDILDAEINDEHRKEEYCPGSCIRPSVWFNDFEYV